VKSTVTQKQAISESIYFTIQSMNLITTWCRVLWNILQLFSCLLWTAMCCI